MTKFVVTKEVPSEMTQYEQRIDPPSLLQEVQNCWNHRPANGLTGVNWLRQIANEITKWDKLFNTYRHTVPTDYQGIPFSTPEEVADVVLKMVMDKYPQVVDNWIEHCIKIKPAFTKLIWFTGDHKQTSKFSANFVDKISVSEVDAYMGRHGALKKFPTPAIPEVKAKASTKAPIKSTLKLDDAEEEV